MKFFINNDWVSEKMYGFSYTNIFKAITNTVTTDN